MSHHPKQSPQNSASQERKRLSLERYVDGVLRGNRMVLARAITVIESDLPSRWRTRGAHARQPAAPFRANRGASASRACPASARALSSMPRHAPDPRPRRKRRGAERRSLQPDFGRQHPGRQDAHGAACGRASAPSSGRPHRGDIWAASPGGRAKPSCCAKPPAIKTSWWKPWESASRKPPSAP